MNEVSNSSGVDVIVPCYRYAHFLRECVESVLTNSSSKVKVRVLIIDDASPDNTAEVAEALVQKDSRITFVRHAVNRGHIATYNEGIEWIAAKYMLLLSADDYLLPGALARSIALMDTHSEVGFTFGKAVISGDSGITGQPDSSISNGKEVEPRILSGVEFIKRTQQSGSVNIVPTPTAVVRTELQKRLGGYRADLPHTGDMEMWLRLAAHGSVGVFESCQAVWRRHGANMQLQYYNSQRQLPDLEQRKAAIDCFYKTCKSVLSNPEQLHRDLLRPLADEGVALAGSAFNAGELEVSKQLSDFGAEIDPEVTKSFRWVVLACKRGLGFRAWRTLQPVVACLRKRQNSL